jgi:hypothetical protein
MDGAELLGAIQEGCLLAGVRCPPDFEEGGEDSTLLKRELSRCWLSDPDRLNLQHDIVATGVPNLDVPDRVGSVQFDAPESSRKEASGGGRRGTETPGSDEEQQETTRHEYPTFLHLSAASHVHGG